MLVPPSVYAWFVGCCEEGEASRDVKVMNKARLQVQSRVTSMHACIGSTCESDSTCNLDYAATQAKGRQTVRYSESLRIIDCSGRCNGIHRKVERCSLAYEAIIHQQLSTLLLVCYTRW